MQQTTIRPHDLGGRINGTPGYRNFYPFSRRQAMTDHIYKLIELTGSSKNSIEEAVQNAIAKAARTVHKLHWFQVLETRGNIDNGNVAYWQVTIKVGFTLED
jgi:dodecin